MAMAALVVLPSLLPLAATGCAAVAAFSGGATAGVVVLLALTVKAAATAALRQHAGTGAGVGAAIGTGVVGAVLAVPFEVIGDLLLPLHMASALIRPHRITWREREISSDDGGVELR